jgi:hypothetical protein
MPLHGRHKRELFAGVVIAERRHTRPTHESLAPNAARLNVPVAALRFGGPSAHDRYFPTRLASELRGDRFQSCLSSTLHTMYPGQGHKQPNAIRSIRPSARFCR